MGFNSLIDINVSKNETPVSAYFTADKYFGVAPLRVNFTNLSWGSNLQFEWDFGDGSPISTMVSPSHVFEQEGIYIVTLKAYNSLFSSQFSVPIYVSKYFANPLAPPQAFFTLDTWYILKNHATAFHNQSFGINPLSYTWDFGDGSTSTDTNPVHTYTQTGIYLVTLTATDTVNGLTSVFMRPVLVLERFLISSYNINVLSKIFYNVNNKRDFPIITSTDIKYAEKILNINPNDYPPIVWISAFPTNGFVPLEVNFFAVSTTDSALFSWDFGDGTTATGISASHTYNLGGIYTVKLSASNDHGTTFAEVNIYVLDYLRFFLEFGFYDRYYLMDRVNSKVYIFDKRTNNLLKYFGGKGEAPQQFNKLTSMDILKPLKRIKLEKRRNTWL